MKNGLLLCHFHQRALQRRAAVLGSCGGGPCRHHHHSQHYCLPQPSRRAHQLLHICLPRTAYTLHLCCTHTLCFQSCRSTKGSIRSWTRVEMAADEVSEFQANLAEYKDQLSQVRQRVCVLLPLSGDGLSVSSVACAHKPVTPTRFGLRHDYNRATFQAIGMSACPAGRPRCEGPLSFPAAPATSCNLLLDLQVEALLLDDAENDEYQAIYQELTEVCLSVPLLLFHGLLSTQRHG